MERILYRLGRFRSKEAPYSGTHSHMLDGEPKVVSYLSPMHVELSCRPISVAVDRRRYVIIT